MTTDSHILTITPLINCFVHLWILLETATLFSLVSFVFILVAFYCTSIPYTYTECVLLGIFKPQTLCIYTHL